MPKPRILINILIVNIQQIIQNQHTMGKSGEAMGNMRIFSTHIISCPLKKAEKQ